MIRATRKFFDKLIPQSVQDFWERIIVTKMKHLAYVGLLLGILITAFQYQVSALNAARFDDICENRIQSRADYRVVLSDLVDLSQLLPDSQLAQDYTRTRLETIDRRLPALTEQDCA